MSNLFVVTGYNNWSEYIRNATQLPDSLLAGDIPFWLKALINGSFPQGSTKVKALDGSTKPNSFLFNDGESVISVVERTSKGEDEECLKLTSVTSLYYRFLSRNLRGESPMDFLDRDGDKLIKSIYDAVLVAYPEMSEDEAIEYIKANLIKFVSQFMNEKKMLVNTFPYWRVWSVMHQRLTKALEVIDRGDDIRKLVSYCGMFDPTAGWGDRLVSILLIKGYLLNKVRESKYSNMDIEWFANVLFYVGCDTNAGLQPIYEQAIRVICDYFNMGYGSAVVHCVNCISTRGIRVAMEAADNGITVLQTSIPTPWEIYGVDLPEGDSLVLSNFQGHVDPAKLGESQSRWMDKFLYPFMNEVVTIFTRSVGVIRSMGFISDIGRCAYIHADGYTTKYIDRYGKEKSFVSDIGGDIMSIFKNFGSIYGIVKPFEICFGWDSAIKDKKCDCRRNACRKCDSCKEYGVCNTIPCNKAEPCYRFILRSCYVAGTYI